MQCDNGDTSPECAHKVTPTYSWTLPSCLHLSWAGLGRVWTALQGSAPDSQALGWMDDPGFAASATAALEAHPSSTQLWGAYFAKPSLPLLQWEAVTTLAPRFPESVWVDVVLPLIARGLHAAQTVRIAHVTCTLRSISLMQTYGDYCAEDS